VLVRFIGLLAAILLVGGLLAAALVRVAPGFGTDERMPNPKLNTSSGTAILYKRTI
jgi:hypothetical protein